MIFKKVDHGRFKYDDSYPDRLVGGYFISLCYGKFYVNYPVE